MSLNGFILVIVSLGASCFRRAGGLGFWARLGSLLGVLVMIRPANVYLLPAVFCFLAFQAFWRRCVPVKGIVVALAASVLPMLPQLYMNVVLHHRFTPLVARSLGEFQLTEGMRLIKFAGSFTPSYRGAVRYQNPVAPALQAGCSTAASCYVRSPKLWLFTSALHVFNLVDQDSMFVYVKSFSIWYRWLGSLLSALMWLIGGVGLFMALWNAKGRLSQRTSESSFDDPAVLSILIAGSFLALHAHVAVEARFGLPLLTLLSFWMGLSLPLLRSRKTALLALIVGVALHLGLSVWVQRQAPLLAGDLSIIGGGTHATNVVPTSPKSFSFVTN